MKKRILSVLLITVLMLSVIAVSVSAASVYRNIQTPSVVYGTDYPAQTITADGNSATLAVPLSSNVQVAEVGADFIKFTQIDANAINTLAGTSFSYAVVTDGNVGTYTAFNANKAPAGATEFTLSGLAEGVTYSIKILGGTVSDSSNNRYMMKNTGSNAIQVTTTSFVDAGAWDAPEGLSVKDGKLVGTENGKTYQFVKLSAPDFAIDTASYADYDAASTTLAAGLYAVRIKAGVQGSNRYTDSDPVVVLAKGALTGTLPRTGWTIVSTYGNISVSANQDYKGFATQIQYSYQDKYVYGAYTYNFTDEEIIGVYDLLSFEFTKGMGTGGNHVKSSDGSTSKVYGLATFHVTGGTVAKYEVPFEWDYKIATKVTLDLAAVAGADAEGYVYGVEIDFWDETNPENATIVPAEEHDLYQHQGSGPYYSYQIISFTLNADSRIVLGARVPETTPVIYAEGTETAGTYRILGLDATKNYAFSTDGVTYSDVAAGSTYIEVTTTGTFYVYAKASATTYDSAVASVKIEGAMPAIPEGTLSYNEQTGQIEGLGNISSTGLNTLTYQWCRVSVDGKLSWNQEIKSDAGSVQVGPGYYAFRYAARQNLVAGATTYIFVMGDGSLKGTVSTATPPSAERTNGFISGAWTISATEYSNNKAYNEGASKRLAAAYTTRLEDITDLAWQYQLAEDEIFPLNELGTMKFQIGFANAKRYNSDYIGKVRLYIAEGDAAYYDVPFVAAHNTMTTVDVASIWADEVELDPNFTPNGYVIAVAIYYFTEEGIDGVSVTTASDYAVATLGGNDPVTLRANQFFNLKTVVDISSIKTVPAVGTYGGEIIGLNPEAVYQVAEYDESTQTLGTWSYAPIGTYVNLPAGTYAIRSYSVATDTKYLPSDYVIVTIDPAPAGDTRESAKVDKLILPDEVVVSSDANYTFDINESRWINRLALSNIVKESPNATITFQADTYKFTVAAADIDLSLDTAHYFDMKVTFNGESVYDRMYPKMAALADEKELVSGVHFESTTPYFFEKATFEVFLGEKYDGYDVELRSYNERVNRLRNEETVTVDGGWATFSTFGGDYLILCPAMAEEE